MTRLARKHPSLFGVPFLLIMVGASYGLTIFTQARYDLHDQKVKNVSIANSIPSPSLGLDARYLGVERTRTEIEER